MTWPLHPIMFQKRWYSLSRYFSSGGKTDRSADCLADHGGLAWKTKNVLGPRAINGLGVAHYGRSGPEKPWIVPSLICNEYANQTMFCQNQAFPTEKSQILSGIFWFPKKAKGVKKPEFQNLPSKTPNWQPWTAMQINSRRDKDRERVWKKRRSTGTVALWAQTPNLWTNLCSTLLLWQ